MIRSPHAGPRSGATLVEVLMSLLIMSIGIVSVITMFPLAVLRSIQATQLTNSRMMTQNTEQSFRTLFHDSASAAVSFDILNYHVDPAVASTAARFRGTWLPGTTYYFGQIVTPSRPKGTYLPASEAWMICYTGGVSGSIEPHWETGSPNIVADEGTDGLGNARPQWISWYDPTAAIPPAIPRRNGGPRAYYSVLSLTDPRLLPPLPPGIATFYNARNYVLDPLGWATFSADYDTFFDTTASPNDFGYIYSKATGLASAAGTRPLTSAPATSATPFLLRLNGGATSVDAAEALAAHPDSWSVEVLPTVLETYTATTPYAGLRTATFPLPVDLSAIASSNLSNGDLRIILTSLSNSQSYVRVISAANPATRTVGWDEPLPISFVPDGPARIERRDRRFTWMATVNKDYEGHTKVTVVTFFKRGLKPEEEHAFRANVGSTTADQIVVNWTPIPADPAPPTPLMREGNYLFDAINVSWYRIVAVAVSGTTATITVDRPVPQAQRTTTGRIILMRGIVELFEITL